jgi:hypothetical protein
MRDRILRQIAKAHAQAPFREDELARRLGVDATADPAALEAELTRLYAARQIGRALITRKGRTFGVVWPTGYIGPAPAFTVSPGRPRPAGPSSPGDSPMRHTASPETRISTAMVFAAIAESAETTRQQLIARFGADKTCSIDAHLQSLTRQGRIERLRQGVVAAVPGAAAPRERAPRPIVSPPAPAPAEQPQVSKNGGSTPAGHLAPPERAVMDTPRAEGRLADPGAGDHEGHATFLADSDGRLAIRTGTADLVLDPADAARLADFCSRTRGLFSSTGA